MAATETWDAIIVGGGTAGLSAAIHAAAAGRRTLVLERLERLGGTLHVSTGQMSAAGTSLQAERGIEDSPDLHYQDVMRITRGTAHAAMARKAVDAAPETIEWLRRNGFAFHPDCPAIVYNHEPYSRPRTYWGTEKGLSILKVLAARIAEAEARGGLETRTNWRLQALLPDGEDRVGGVLAAGPDGATTELRARSVVLTTGGYAGNPESFAAWTGGRPLYGPLHPTATGDGIRAALALGADLWCGEHFLPSIGGFEEEPGSHRVAWTERPQLTPQHRLPWEILVRRDGQRFMAEDEPSIDVREHALLERTDLTFWVVFDQAILDAAPPLFPQWPPGRLAAMFGRHHAFLSAGSLRTLAEACGIAPGGLAETVARYNAAQSGRTQDELGRRHMPAPIATPPFHAIRNHGVSIKSPAGLRIDTQFRVQRRPGGGFANLYATGEATGGGLLSGRAYVGGMSLTPALGFGREIGRALP